MAQAVASMAACAAPLRRYSKGDFSFAARTGASPLAGQECSPSEPSSSRLILQPTGRLLRAAAVPYSGTWPRGSAAPSPRRCLLRRGPSRSALRPRHPVDSILETMGVAPANLHGTSQIFLDRPKIVKDSRPVHRPRRVTVCSGNTTREAMEAPQSSAAYVSRRASIGIFMATIFQHFGTGTLRAEEEGNGLWLTGPLPVPTVSNDIANKETSTRSFLRNGIYMPNIGTEGSVYRLNHYAFDLLALADLLEQDAWSYVRKYLCLKSTVMYFDFDKVITAAPAEQKQPLTALANRLFDSVEKLEEAVKKRDDLVAKSCYSNTAVILKEVMDRMV